MNTEQTLVVDRDILKRMEFSSLLDHIRWIAAFIVTIGHIRHIFFVEYSEVINPNFFHLVLYFITRIAHEAVLVFFLVSGLLVGGKFADSSNWRGFDYTKYFIARLVRLYLVLFPALLLTLLLTVIAFACFGRDVSVDLSLDVVLGNMIFLQGVVVPCLSMNTPLWSLTNEFWYYVLTPLFVFIASTTSNKLRFVASFVASVIVLVLMFTDDIDERNVLLYYPVWLFGICLIYRIGFKPSLVFTFVACGVSLVFSRVQAYDHLFLAKDYLFAVSFWFVLLAIRSREWSARESMLISRFATVGNRLGRQSYSLYLFHYPVCAILAVAGVHLWGIGALQPTLINCLAGAAVVVVCYLIAELSYNLFEARTGTVSRFLEKRIRSESKGPVGALPDVGAARSSAPTTNDHISR